MLRELLDTLRTTCAPGARPLGLAYESAAIAARHRRVGTSWAPHLAASHAAILQAAACCQKHDRVIVIGAGACLDVPVKELANQFTEVILADVTITPEARRWQRHFPGRVRALHWDATGALTALAAQRRTLSSMEVEYLFTESNPSLPIETEADLTVSANCLSQLGLIPADNVKAAEKDDELLARCTQAAAWKHLRWMSERSGTRLLISDIAQLDIAPDGRELARHPLFNELKLRQPDQTWHWNLAPIPEWSRHWHRIHEVGAWLDAPST